MAAAASARVRLPVRIKRRREAQAAKNTRQFNNRAERNYFEGRRRTSLATILRWISFEPP